MVWVLSQDDHFDLVKRGVVESGEDVAAFGVAGVLLTFGNEELFELGKVG